MNLLTRCRSTRHSQIRVAGGGERRICFAAERVAGRPSMVGRHRMADRHDERSVGPALSGSVPLHSAGHSRGTDQAGGRLYNERLILSLIRRHGILSKVETAHLTGLSVQTAGGMMKRVEQDWLL